MYFWFEKCDNTLYVLLDMSKVSPCSAKEADLQRTRYLVSAYFTIIASWSDVGQSSGWKLVAT